MNFSTLIEFIFKDVLGHNEQQPMIFTRIEFWYFFAVVYVFFVFSYKKIALRTTYLVIFSLFFYYKTSGLFVILLLFTITNDYFIGRALHRIKSKRKRYMLVAMSITTNLLILSYFKYATFFADSFNYIASDSLLNSMFGGEVVPQNIFAQFVNWLFDANYTVDKILLPIGISFYTFQAISYTVDIYREKLEPVKNYIDFAFFVSFFPQLVAGPIVKASEFIPQIYKPYSLTKDDFGKASFMILRGLVKKIVISDFIAVNFIDRIFDNPTMYTGAENLFSLYAYSLQVYCDFSGYTDIAIGIALFFGFRLSDNFNSPYKAENVADFWRRWHISLSSWLKNYLYFSIGGNRFGLFRTDVNIMITMLLGGLWHGASWQFVIWGGLNGIGLLVYKHWSRNNPWKNKRVFLGRFWAIMLTFNFITFTRIFFRAETMETVELMFVQIGTNFRLDLVGEIIGGYWKVFALMGLGYLFHWLPTSIKNGYTNAYIRAPYWLQLIYATVLITLIYQFYSADFVPFIYFQF